MEEPKSSFEVFFVFFLISFVCLCSSWHCFPISSTWTSLRPLRRWLQSTYGEFCLFPGCFFFFHGVLVSFDGFLGFFQDFSVHILMGFSYFCFLIHCNQWTPLIALFLVFPFLRNIFWLIVNRVGGSGMDLRSKARVISYFFSYVLILVLFDCFRLFWCFSLEFFFFMK